MHSRLPGGDSAVKQVLGASAAPCSAHDGRPSLTVAISTRGASCFKLRPALWPTESGVDYLVLVQDGDCDPGIAPFLSGLQSRPDVTVVMLEGLGLSRSRNAAMDVARGEIVAICDDDVSHCPGAFDAIRRFFAEHPGQSLLAGQSFTPDGAPRRRFASQGRALSLRTAAGLSSHEIAYRRDAVRRSGVRFDTRYGVGSGTDATLGEEYIFVADCLRAGLRGRYEPLPISIHPPMSSGLDWTGAHRSRARAAVFQRVFGRMAAPVRVAFAIKNRRRFASMADAWQFLRG